ncbi:hypothetical protein GCM10020370_18450 [Paenibacillus hodogayensis]
MGSIARTGAKRREHAIEINRCDLHRGVGVWSKFNEDFNTPLASIPVRIKALTEHGSVPLFVHKEALEERPCPKEDIGVDRADRSEA